MNSLQLIGPSKNSEYEDNVSAAGQNTTVQIKQPGLVTAGVEMSHCSTGERKFPG